MKKQQIKKGRFRFEQTWVFPKEVNEFIDETFTRLEIDEKTLCHVFSGLSKIGGLTVNIEPLACDLETKRNIPDLVADCLDLPDILGCNTQENILADFPWKIPYGKRRYFSYALRDICKVGGYLILNAPWSPWVKGLELLEVWKVTQAFNSYRELVDFWVFRKIEDAEDLK